MKKNSDNKIELIREDIETDVIQYAENDFQYRHINDIADLWDLRESIEKYIHFLEKLDHAKTLSQLERSCKKSFIDFNDYIAED